MAAIDDSETQDSEGRTWAAHQCSECDGLVIAVSHPGDPDPFNEMDFPPDVLMWIRRQIDAITEGGE